MCRVELPLCGMCRFVVYIWSAIGLVVKYLVAIEMPRVRSRMAHASFVRVSIGLLIATSLSNRVIHISSRYDARFYDFNPNGAFYFYTIPSLQSTIYIRCVLGLVLYTLLSYNNNISSSPLRQMSYSTYLGCSFPIYGRINRILEGR